MTFAIDGTLLQLIPQAGASAKNPDWGLPRLSEVNGEIFIEQTIEGEEDNQGDIAVSRRISLGDVEAHLREELSKNFSQIDFSAYRQGKITKVLEQIPDSALQRIFLALLTFLNPRQIAMVLYLYKKASEQEAEGHRKGEVTFETNELLKALGYKPDSRGYFNSRVRSQIHQDLVALHKINLVFAQAIEMEGSRDARLIIKSILIIEEFTVKNYPRKFNLDEVFLHMHGAADTYTITLRFYGGKGGLQDSITLSNDICLSQTSQVNSKHNYRLKLIIYISSRLRWDKPDGSGYYYIARKTLFKHLGLFGKNTSRQSQTLWQAIDELIEEGIIESAHDVEGDRKAPKIAIKLNSEKISVALEQLPCSN